MKKELTQEEEAEEIVRRLKMPPREILEEAMFIKMLAEEMAKEIDEQVLLSIKQKEA